MIDEFLRNKWKHMNPLIDYTLKCTLDFCLFVFQPNRRQVIEAGYEWHKLKH